MPNPERPNFEEEFQKFKTDQKEQIRTSDELDKEETITEEKNMFSKFRGSAKSIARFLILLTALTFTTKPEIKPKGPISEKPKITFPEKKTEHDWHEDKDYQELIAKVEGHEPLTMWDIYAHSDKPYFKEVAEEFTKENPDFVLREGIINKKVVNKPWLKDIMLDAYSKANDTDTILQKISYLSDVEWGRELCVDAFKNNPNMMGSFQMGLIKKYEDINDPEFQTLLSMYKNFSKERPQDANYGLYLFAKDISEGKLTISDAEKISGDNLAMLNYFAQSPENLKKPGTKRKLKGISQRLIATINFDHNEPDEKRFKPLENISSRGLYLLMSMGSEELYTSSYNGAFDRLMAKMKNENISSGAELIRSMNYSGFRTFVEMASRYNRLNEFLKTMNQPEQNFLIAEMVNGIKDEKDKPKEASTLADILGSIDNHELNEILKENIKHNYVSSQKENNTEDETIYGLLGSLLENNIYSDDKLLLEMKKKYKMPSVEKLPVDEMFDINGIDTQEYYFYDDEDGKLSFADFLDMYKNDNNWQIQDKGKFIEISSKGSGNKIIMFANKPEFDKSAHSEINDEINKNNLKKTVIVHRGHSYYVNETLKNVSSDTQFVFLGSCGGYKEISDILEKNPDAQVISTKGKGTGLINDPLLKNINNAILSGDIEWSKFWNETRDNFIDNKDFSNYIPPNKNQSLRFLKAYNTIVGK